MRYPMYATSFLGKSPAISAQRRLNLYYQIEHEGERSRLSIHGAPGLQLFADFGDEPIRGRHVIGALMYVVHRGTLWEVTAAGAKTSRGTLATTSGKVSMVDNGTQLMIMEGGSVTWQDGFFIVTKSVAGSKGYIFNTSTLAFAEITDVDFTGIVEGTGRFYLSALNDGLSWSALDFATAESSPDPLSLVISDHGELGLFGTTSTEFWANVGGAFPFARINGANMEWGLAAKNSLSKFNDALIGLFRNRNGEAIVGIVSGYKMRQVSNTELTSTIKKYPTVEDAVGFSYLQDGRAFYQVSFPSGMKSWLYESTTNSWSERSSSGSRHRAELHADFSNSSIVTDYANGKMYRLTTDAYDDNGAMIERELVGRHVNGDGSRIEAKAFELEMEVGVGLAQGQGSDPTAMLQVSRNAGRTFGGERWKSFGKIGEYRTRCRWRGLGVAHDMVFKARITDPVKVVITGAYLEADLLDGARGQANA